MLQVYFGSTPVNKNDTLDWDTANDGITFFWKTQPNELYALVMYDFDAIKNSYKTRHIKNIYLHYMNINIRGKNLNTGNELISYQEPNPSGKPHRYIILLYRQFDELALDGKMTRTNFEKDGLSALGEVIDSILFTVTPKNYRQYPENYFPENSELDQQSQKYCRCVAHVSSKQKAQCLRDQSLVGDTMPGGKKCYSPYAICSKTVPHPGTRQKCFSNYNYENLPDDELVAMSQLEHISIPRPYDRNKLLQRIHNYKNL